MIRVGPLVFGARGCRGPITKSREKKSKIYEFWEQTIKLLPQFIFGQKVDELINHSLQ